MSADGMAFGVDPRRRERYSLRQSRYFALALDCSRLAGEKKRRGERLTLLDIGVQNGVAMRYIEVQPDADNIDFYGADIKIGKIYRGEVWKAIYQGDFMQGYPEIADDSFDVVICEQVLEHLPELETAVRTFERVLKPGGTLIVGVPIFIGPFAWLRSHFVPFFDRFTHHRKARHHVQAFSLCSIKKLLQVYTRLQIDKVRGFRIISGGILRPLENRRWWWRFNTWLGGLIPAVCIEIQLIAHKGDTNGPPKALEQYLFIFV